MKVKALERNLCTLVDYIYRLGLLEGLKISKSDGMEYLRTVGKGTSHERLDGTKPTTIEWIEEVKHLCNKAHNKRRRDGLYSNMNKLSEFIGRTILNQKLLKENEA